MSAFMLKHAQLRPEVISPRKIDFKKSKRLIIQPVTVIIQFNMYIS